MKKSDKKFADRQLKKAIREGIKELSEEQLFQILHINQLLENLKDIEKYKNLGLNVIAEKLEKRLTVYEDLIDKKYWNPDALFYVTMAISCRVADTLKEACQMYDEFKSMKK